MPLKHTIFTPKCSAEISVTNSVPWDGKFYISANGTVCCLFLNEAEIYFACCGCSAFLLSLVCLHICLHFICLSFSPEVWETLVAARTHTHADWSEEWYRNPLLHVWLTVGKEYTAKPAASTVRRVSGKRDGRRKELEEVLITSVACSTVSEETQTNDLADFTVNMPISWSRIPRFLYLLTSCLMYSDDTPYGWRQCFP